MNQQVLGSLRALNTKDLSAMHTGSGLLGMGSSLEKVEGPQGY